MMLSPRSTAPFPQAPARRAIALLAICTLALAGCSNLLPKSRAEVSSPWKSYEQARATLDCIVPYKTTAAELKAQGIDPYVTPNVQVLDYSDILLRFPVTAGISPDRLDRGLRECLEAGDSCKGYTISVRDIKRDRVGNFWLDALSFSRVVDVSGWTFNAIVLVVEGRVVYAIHGGQPLVKERETSRQPLGPLQGWGDALGSAFR